MYGDFAACVAQELDGRQTGTEENGVAAEELEIVFHEWAVEDVDVISEHSE